MGGPSRFPGCQPVDYQISRGRVSEAIAVRDPEQEMIWSASGRELNYYSVTHMVGDGVVDA